MERRLHRLDAARTFTSKRVFDDGAHTVELYEFNSPHYGELIIAYLPKEKILFEADVLDLDIPESGTAPAGEDTADLADRIQQPGLQVERIVPVHGRLGNIEDLRRAAPSECLVQIGHSVLGARNLDCVQPPSVLREQQT